MQRILNQAQYRRVLVLVYCTVALSEALPQPIITSFSFFLPQPSSISAVHGAVLMFFYGAELRCDGHQGSGFSDAKVFFDASIRAGNESPQKKHRLPL